MTRRFYKQGFSVSNQYISFKIYTFYSKKQYSFLENCSRLTVDLVKPPTRSQYYLLLKPSLNISLQFKCHGLSLLFTHHLFYFEVLSSCVVFFLLFMSCLVSCSSVSHVLISPQCFSLCQFFCFHVSPEFLFCFHTSALCVSCTCLFSHCIFVFL